MEIRCPFFVYMSTRSMDYQNNGLSKVITFRRKISYNFLNWFLNRAYLFIEFLLSIYRILLHFL